MNEDIRSIFSRMKLEAPDVSDEFLATVAMWAYFAPRKP